MAEIKLNKRYKYAGDIFSKLIDIGFDIEVATSFLNDIEDADVVEVVRCKDCTEWDKNECECSHWYGFRENDFCSYGQRK